MPVDRTQHMSSRLIAACRSGDTAQAQAIVAQFPEAIRIHDDLGWNALHHACAAGAQLDAVHALVLADPDALAVRTAMSATGPSCPAAESTVLHVAASSPACKVEVVEFLLQQRPSLAREINAEGRTALHCACHGSGHGNQTKAHATLDIVRTIYSASMDVLSVKDAEGYLPIHLSFLSGAPGSQIRYLAHLDPSSVSVPLPNGRLLAHHIGHNLARGDQKIGHEVLDSLLAADPATVYQMDPETGKTLVGMSQDPSFGHTRAAALFRETVRKHEGRRDLQPKSLEGGTKMPPSKLTDSTCKSDTKVAASSSKVEALATKVSAESIADQLVLACADSNSAEQVRFLLKTRPDVSQVRDQQGFLPLHWAAYHGASADILALFHQAWPQSVREKTSGGLLPLHLACRRSASLESVKLLVDKFPESVEQPGPDGKLAIHHACRGVAPLEVVQFLVDQSPTTLSEMTTEGLLPLHIACAHGKSQGLIQFLVERWPQSLRVPNREGSLPIHLVCKGGTSVPLEWMIRQDSSLLETQDSEGNLPLHLLCVNAKSTEECIRSVVDAFPEATSRKNKKGSTPIDLAAQSKPELANLLESHLPSSKKRRTGGSNPLHQACSDPRVTVEMIRNILAESPDDVCVPDEERMLPLHLALRSGASIEVVEYLVGEYPDGLRWTNRGGSVPLHTACSNQASGSVVRYLITAWPKATNVANSYGWLPLHCACFYGASWEVVSLLLRSNAKSTRMATYGQSDYPLHLACSGAPTLDVIFSLIEAREDGVELKNGAGQLALHKALLNDAPMEVVQFLVEKYPHSLFVTDQQGATPYAIAEMRKQHDIARWLKSKEI